MNKEKILLIDDDKDNLRFLARILEHESYKVLQATSGLEGIQLLKDFSPDLVILDINMPQLNGFQTMKLLRQKDEHVSVIFLTANNSTEDIIRGLESGALDYICKPFNPLELVARVRSQLKFKRTQQELREANRKLQSLVDIDDLTGLYNMRSIYDRLNNEIERARRYKHGLAVIMMDMDHFKNVNDGHDHLFGSYVLSQVGEIVKKNIRSVDFAARYGGDEFLICLTQTQTQGALRFADRLRKVISETEFTQDKDQMHMTASFGVALIEGKGAVIDAHTLVRIADTKLYEAKDKGRNRVEGEIITDDGPIDPRSLRKVG
ncbi:MAG: diguanylate cyclase [Bdellovibrionales bacterium]|nr:diguanylate cyclase [Bdellovibrionales bacterium]